MNELLDNITADGRLARFEARAGDFSGIFNVTYRYADENGIRYIFARDRSRDEAEGLARDLNHRLEDRGALAPR